MSKSKGLNTNNVFTTAMLKQIYAKSLGGEYLGQMYKESMTYLKNIGFHKTQLLSVTDRGSVYRWFVFTQMKEEIMIEYKKDDGEESLKLVFSPSDVEFIYDILLMRFNQIAAEEKDKVFIYNT